MKVTPSSGSDEAAAAAALQVKVKQKLAKLVAPDAELLEMAESRFDGWKPIDDNRATVLLSESSEFDLPMAAVRDDGGGGALALELAALKVSALRKRCLAAGVE
eukprot:SAG11_NODE_7913_length_1081_cov_1.521385_2_plen_103_part_01